MSLTWQSGYLQGVDYRLQRPAPLNDATTLDDVMHRREADAVVALANVWPEGLSADALTALGAIPTVMIGPRATRGLTPSPTVALATATTGFDATGTVVRSDGVSLPLRPVRAPSLAEDRDVIGRVIAAIKGVRSS